MTQQFWWLWESPVVSLSLTFGFTAASSILGKFQVLDLTCKILYNLRSKYQGGHLLSYKKAHPEACWEGPLLGAAASLRKAGSKGARAILVAMPQLQNSLPFKLRTIFCSFYHLLCPCGSVFLFSCFWFLKRKMLSFVTMLLLHYYLLLLWCLMLTMF